MSAEDSKSDRIGVVDKSHHKSEQEKKGSRIMVVDTGYAHAKTLVKDLLEKHGLDADLEVLDESPKPLNLFSIDRLEPEIVQKPKPGGERWRKKKHRKSDLPPGFEM